MRPRAFSPNTKLICCLVAWLAVSALLVAGNPVPCSNWVVITSIHAPTPAVRKLAAMPGWNVVVVGDLKTPLDWACPNVTYLGPDAQRSLEYRIVELLPWNSYARKSVGYLYAISRGASVIYETDDDNLLQSDSIPLLPDVAAPVGSIRAPAAATYQRVVNPYAAFGAPTVWPRGYPLRAIGESAAVAHEPPAPTVCAIQQQLADADPDVDAIFRLTRASDVGHIHFDATAPPVAISKGTYTPWNSQNTAIMAQAFWALLIPASAPFRVCDIWRAYFVQRLLWALGANVCFMGPSVTQDRNPHDLYDDFFDEIELYRDAERLIQALERWTLPKGPFKERLVNLWAFMRDEGFVGDSDVRLAEAWVADLDEAEYVWPTIVTPHAGRRIWSTDLHTAAHADARYTLGLEGVTVASKNADVMYCAMFDRGCDPAIISDPTVARMWSRMGSSGRWSHISLLNRHHFFEAFRNEPDFRAADAIICQFPASACELYMPFGKPMIVYPTHRFDMGRLSAPAIERWVKNLRAIAAKPDCLVIASNEYERAYIEYFTGVEAEVVPSLNGYISSSYDPSPETHPAIIINRKYPTIIKQQLIVAARERGLPSEFASIRELYPNGYQWRDVVQHRAAVWIPYAVQIYTLTELYRANIPIFCPSLDLLVRWESEYGIFKERKANAEICYSFFLCDEAPMNASLLSPHSKTTTAPDPNADSDTALRWWLRLSDWLQPHMRHVVLFDSIDDLMTKMENTDLLAVSRSMAVHNAELRASSRHTWMRLLGTLWSAPVRREPIPLSYDAGAALYPHGDFTDEPFWKQGNCPEALGASRLVLHTNFQSWKNKTVVAEKGLPHTLMLRTWIGFSNADHISLAGLSCALDSNLSACYTINGVPAGLPEERLDSQTDVPLVVNAAGFYTIEAALCDGPPDTVIGSFEVVAPYTEDPSAGEDCASADLPVPRTRKAGGDGESGDD